MQPTSAQIQPPPSAQNEVAQHNSVIADNTESAKAQDAEKTTQTQLSPPGGLATSLPLETALSVQALMAQTPRRFIVEEDSEKKEAESGASKAAGRPNKAVVLQSHFCVPDFTFDTLVAKTAHFHTQCKNIPTQHNNPETLKALDVKTKAEMVKYAQATHPIMHQDVMILIGDFLAYKKKHGSEIEKQLYASMTPQQFIDRLLTHRPIVFYHQDDSSLLRDQTKLSGGFEAIGTPHEKAPLILKDYLSYAEMQISALIGVSVRTHFINDGARKNVGIAGKVGTFQKDGVYVGLVGARLEKPGFMEWQHMMITKEQNTAENGYGAKADSQSSQRKALEIWEKLYKLNGRFPSYEEVEAHAKDYVAINMGKDNPPAYLHPVVCKARSKLTALTFLTEANARGQVEKKSVYTVIVGLGLGTWQMDTVQGQWMIEAYSQALCECAFPNISHLEFSWFFKAFPVNVGENRHIKYSFTKGNPAAKLTDSHSEKLLVAQYAWDSNSAAGNEYWVNDLESSGDPAAACCSYIVPLQIPEINPHVCAANIKVIHTVAAGPDLSKALSVPAVQTLLDQHSAKLLTSDGGPLVNVSGDKLATELIVQTYKSGLPMFTDIGEYDSNKSLIDDMKLIWICINQAPSTQQIPLLKRLADCFLDCQIVQARMIVNMAHEMRGFQSYPAKVLHYWNQFKDRKLEQFILNRHPNALTSSELSKQMPHLKSGYLMAMGKQNAMEGYELSKADKFKPLIKFTSEMQLEFVKAVQDGFHEFLLELAQEINYQAMTISSGKEVSASALEGYRVFLEWINSTRQDIEDVGLYHAKKDYAGLAKPHSDQEKGLKVYISVSEVREIMMRMPWQDQLMLQALHGSNKKT